MRTNYAACIMVYQNGQISISRKTYDGLEILLNSKKFEYTINAKEKNIKS